MDRPHSFPDISDDGTQPGIIDKTGRHISSLLFRLAGADPKALGQCTSIGKTKFVALGMLVIIVAVAACASMTHMVTGIAGMGNGAYFVGAGWGLFWGVIEVLIVTSSKPVGPLRGRILSFLLRGMLGLIPVISFSTVWFIETNKPEIRLAVETIRNERELVSAKSLSEIIDVKGRRDTTASISSEIKSIKDSWSTPPSYVLAAEEALSRASSAVAATGRAARNARYELDSAIASAAKDGNMLDTSKKEALSFKVKKTETEFNTAKRERDNASSFLESEKRRHISDTERKIADAEKRLSESNSQELAAAKNFDTRMTGFSDTAAQASEDSFSSRLAGVALLLERDSGKRWQFAFWLAALMLIELAAIGIKIFVVTDADIILSDMMEVSIALANGKRDADIDAIKNWSDGLFSKHRADFSIVETKNLARVEKTILEAQIEKERIANSAISAAASSDSVIFNKTSEEKEETHSVIEKSYETFLDEPTLTTEIAGKDEIPCSSNDSAGNGDESFANETKRCGKPPSRQKMRHLRRASSHARHDRNSTINDDLSPEPEMS